MPEARQLKVLRRRAEFLDVAHNGKKWVAPNLILQAGKPHPNENTAVRYGLTATTKIGNAVIRNRARRRMRALAFEILAAHAAPGRDYVLIARAATATCPYEDLKRDLTTALKKLGGWRDA